MRRSTVLNLRHVLKTHVLTDAGLAERSPLRVLAVGAPPESTALSSILGSLGGSGSTVDVRRTTVDALVDAPPAGADSTPQQFDVVCMVDACDRTIDPVGLLWALGRACRHDGVVVLIAPSTGTSEMAAASSIWIQLAGLAELAERTGLALVDAWRDDAGPAHEVVGVYRWDLRSSAAIAPDRGRLFALDDPLQNLGVDVPDPVIEREEGTMPAGDFLAVVHDVLAPRFYLEIGVWQASSLRLARCPSVGIDPVPDIDDSLPPHLRMAEVSSEGFFRDPTCTALLGPVDLAYVDGLHLSEIALRDFMLVERHAHADSVVLIDDIYPVNTVQGQRTRTSNHWTGDVWKLVAVLARLRPELLMIPLNTRPTGTLMIAGLDPRDRVLWDAHDAIMADLMVDRDPPADVLGRVGVFEPDDPLVGRVMRCLHGRREGRTARWPNTRIADLIAGSLPREVVSIR